MARIKPKLILALGGTAAQSLTGDGSRMLDRRGSIEILDDGTPVLLTVHPSFLLRLRDQDEKQAEMAKFEADLRKAVEMLETLVRGTATPAGIENR
ncbi:uracil-DNA glycosylase family protein [Hoeflea sp.]|uniref:uracil-DNA glycosylase family protein n=1 Tax=Hoeflea sp. TaxID=1940281 RepID=UPI003B518401